MAAKADVKAAAEAIITRHLDPKDVLETALGALGWRLVHFSAGPKASGKAATFKAAQDVAGASLAATSADELVRKAQSWNDSQVASGSKHVKVVRGTAVTT